MSEAHRAWSALPQPWPVAFEQAWTSWRSGSGGVGAVITDPAGAIVAVGRNRICDEPDGLTPLAGTPMAHAEMNALASLPPGPYEGHTLTTTFEPCFMCSATISGTYRLGHVLFAAIDPTWEGLQSVLHQHAGLLDHLPRRVVLGGPFGAFAHVLHLSWVIKHDPAPHAHQRLAPAVLGVARELVDRGVLEELSGDDLGVAEVVAELWARLLPLAEQQEAAGPRAGHDNGYRGPDGRPAGVG